MSVQAINGNGYNHFNQANPHINMHDNNGHGAAIINQLLGPNVFKNGGTFNPKQFLSLSSDSSPEVGGFFFPSFILSHMSLTCSIVYSLT
jgi:hypothetical protein